MPIARSAGVVSRFALLALAATLCSNLQAQTLSSAALAALKPVPQANRIAANANLGPKTQLTGHIPSWANAASQTTTAVDLSSPLHLSIVLRRDPAVQAAFTQFLADQQNPGSPLYHQWLTPQQVGVLFGPTSSDLAAVSSWLIGQGLTVDSVAPSRAILEVSGTTATVANAFRTSFGYFTLNGKARFSAIAEPSIPTALTPVIDSISGLTEIPIEPHSQRNLGPAPASAPQSSSPSPLLTTTSGDHYLTPNDFATIYDINSVYSSGNTGGTIGSAAQHIAIIGRSRVSATDISEYAANTAIASYNLNTIIPGTGIDPGPVCTSANASTCSTAGDQGEATLDVDRVIGTAPGVHADLVVSLTAGGYDGIYVAAAWNVNTLKDTIMTISFGACEYFAGSSGVNLWNTLFSAGAAEGISTFVSAGDSGADGCTQSFVPVTTSYAASINYICSSSYATCVGGTEFNDTANPSTYWSSTNGTGLSSVLSYMPEGAWNEPSSVNSSKQTVYAPASSGGGPSVYITKPIWQTGTTIADGARDTPDVAFPAAGHDGFYACLDYALVADGAPAGSNCTTAGGGYFFYFSGTSAAAPSVAAITALVSTRLASSQGNLNPLLYKLATSTPAAFHDITVATSGVSGCTATTPSMCNNSTPSASGLTGGLSGYLVNTGYDLATGLGSFDVAKFIAAAAIIPTSLALTATPNPANTAEAVALTATLTPGTSTFTPTGSVQFYSNNVAIGPAVTISGNAATFTDTFTTVGTYSITAVYSGDPNFATSTATAVSLVVTAPPFTVTPAVTSYNLISGATTGNTDVIAVASPTTFAGSVSLGCAVTNASGTAAGSCIILPATATLTAGSSSPSTLTINTTLGTSGVLNVKVTGTNGSTTVSSANITVNLTGASFSLAASPTSLSFTSGATTGNTDTITVTSVNGFAGPVALSCVLTGSSPYFPPSCNASSISAPLAAGGTATSIVTIGSTTAQANETIQKAELERSWTLGGGATLAMLFFLPAFRRRRNLGSLLAVVLMALGAISLSGCGNGGTAPATIKSSAGTYTVTVTATGTTTGSTVAATPATTTFSLTIN